MPDAWELRSSLKPTNGTDAVGDEDGDGFTNSAEFRGGTNPRDPRAIRNPTPSPGRGRSSRRSWRRCHHPSVRSLAGGGHGGTEDPLAAMTKNKYITSGTHVSKAIQMDRRRLAWEPYPGLDRKQMQLFHALGKRGRLELLAYLLRHPQEEHTVRELAALARVPTMTASRAVEDLYTLGVVRRRHVGTSYAVSLDPDSGTVAYIRKLIDLARYE